jgi:hypothetical protein
MRTFTSIVMLDQQLTDEAANIPSLRNIIGKAESPHELVPQIGHVEVGESHMLRRG